MTVMKPRHPAVFALCLFFSVIPGVLRAEVFHTYFGTSGPGTKGIYRSSFDTGTGKLTTAVLAAEIGAPGFLALHPDGDKLYAVANFQGGPGAASYRIGKDGTLEPINTSPTGDGGGAHIAVHPTGKFLLTAQYGGGSVALFPLDGTGRLGTAKLTRREGGSRAPEKRQDAPHPPYCGLSPGCRYAH